MKRALLLTVAGSLLVTGCGQKSQTARAADTNSSSGSLVTAPVDYLNAAAKAEQKAVGTIDTTSLNQAIQLFYTDKGRFPKDLNELVTEKFAAKIPETPYGTRLDYDPATGVVKVVKE